MQNRLGWSVYCKASFEHGLGHSFALHEMAVVSACDDYMLMALLITGS